MIQMEIKQNIKSTLLTHELGISLSIYRVIFGLLMCFSMLRFYYNGWVEACYLEPNFHFTYQYFHWIKPITEPKETMYFLVFLAAFAALMIALGIFYRVFSIIFFLLFTYLELIEQSWYLNHYYFVSIVAFLLVFCPANHRFSIDRLFTKNKNHLIPSLYSNILRLQISIVYCYAGLAKINPDWLLDANPLNIWLKAKIDLPIIGSFMAYDSVAYLFSYSGLLYDLFIPFLLWNKTTRPFAFVAVIVFHSMTATLFQIGLFPWIMIVSSLIFITDEEWQRLFNYFKIPTSAAPLITKSTTAVSNSLIGFFGIHFLIQLALPLRPFFYDENNRWTERHYRFAWNVMLVEKSGSTIFRIKEHDTGRTWTAYPKDYLTITQEKQMSFQADMIWQFSRFLQAVYKEKGISNFSIYVDCWVSFNGSLSKLYLPRNLDLLSVSEDEIYDYVIRE